MGAYGCSFHGSSQLPAEQLRDDDMSLIGQLSVTCDDIGAFVAGHGQAAAGGPT